MEYELSESELIRYISPTEIHPIPLKAIASWSELLGITDVVDVADAIMRVSDDGEPDPDPVTGVYEWVDQPYKLLTMIEQRREDEAKKAAEEGRASDPRSPRLRAALAVNKDADVELKALRSCRASVRNQLGVPHPESEAMGTVRAGSMRCGGTPGGVMSAEDRVKVRDLLAERLPNILMERKMFCHSLTNHVQDQTGEFRFIESEGGSAESLVKKYTSEDGQE